MNSASYEYRNMSAWNADYLLENLSPEYFRYHIEFDIRSVVFVAYFANVILHHVHRKPSLGFSLPDFPETYLKAILQVLIYKALYD